MSHLDAVVRISAIDNASAVFARVAAHAKSIGQQFRSIVAAPQQQAAQLSAAAAHFERTAATSMLAPTTGMLSFGLLGKSEYDWDKLWTLMTARFEQPTDAMEQLRQKILEVSNATGKSSLEILEASQLWLQLGGNARGFIPVIDQITKGSILMGLSVKEALSESRALLINFGANPDDPKSVIDMENYLLIGAKSQKWDGHGFVEAMTQAAPIGGAIHMDKDIVGAMVVTMMQGAHQPGVAGRAFKTIMARLMAPTMQMRASLAQLGLGMGDLYQLGVGKVTDVDALERRFAVSGLRLDKDTKEMISKRFESWAADPESVNLDQVVNETIFEVIDRLGIPKSDAENKRLVASAIRSHVTDASSGLDIEKLFQRLGPAGLGALATVFGKERLAPGAELFRNPERFLLNVKRFRDRGETTIKDKYLFLPGSFAFEWDRIVASFNNLLRSIGGSGIKGDIVAPFQAISGFLESLQQYNPTMVRAGFWMTALAAAAPVAALAIGGLAASFKQLAGAALFLVGGPWRAALTALAAFGAYAYSENLGGFADALTELAGAAMTLGPMIKDAGQAFDAFYQSFKASAGISGDANILTDTFTLLGNSIRTIALAFREASAAYAIWKNRDNPDWVPSPAELDKLNRQSFEQHRDRAQLPTGWETIPLYRPPSLMLPTRPGEPLLPPDQSSGALIMDLFKAGAGGLQLPPVSVTGQVSGQMQITVKVDGPGQVTEQSGGQISGPLNTGQGMGDVSSSGLPTFGQ